MHTRELVAVLVLLGMVATGCAPVTSPVTTQFRMTGPMVAPASPQNPPYVAFERYSGKSHRGHHSDESVIAVAPAQVRKSGFTCSEEAFVMWDGPGSHGWDNRADLKRNSVYRLSLQLPPDYETRRMALLREKANTLQHAISDAESRAMGVNGVAMLSDAARLSLEETLIDQVEQWRKDLAGINQQIVALELMLDNPTEPFPRLVNGWIETMDVTSFTKVGAVPFSIEDQYLDWIRQDKVVTIVFFDPNERPEDDAAAQYRDTLPLYWPEGQLTVIEHTRMPSGLPRTMYAGDRARSKIDTKIYRGVMANTYYGEAGEERTYLTTSSGDSIWVFGPDLSPPDNIEVWIENVNGEPHQKLYPSDARTDTRDVSVMQIAGVEGGVLDPIREARKRGQIIAVAYLGNWRMDGDAEVITRLYNNALHDAP